MTSEAEAVDRILAAIEPLSVVAVPIGRAAGFFAAECVHSPAPLPRFDQSSMDGYALRSADTPGALRVSGEQPAGASRSLKVAAGEAVRIFTGAPLPSGADAVAMQEDVEATSSGIRVAQAVPVGEFIRPRGADVCEGQQILAPGDRLTPSRIGLLCATGLTSVLVHCRPRVAVITTGDEVRPAGTDLQPGEIHDANGPMLAAQLAGVADVIGAGHTSDDSGRLAGAIRSFPDAEVIVLSGGVSVGDYDPVHAALRELHAEVDFWRVAVKPGKPFLFARLGSQLVFALPGNSVSTFVTALLFVEPALRRLAGANRENAAPRSITVPLGTSMSNPDSRPHYVRASLAGGAAFPTPLQQSHAIYGLAAADLLIRIDAYASVRQGDPVPAFPLNFR